MLFNPSSSAIPSGNQPGRPQAAIGNLDGTRHRNPLFSEEESTPVMA
jgi:hypothetical protein